MPWNRFKPSSKIFLLTVPRRYFFCGSIVFLCLVFLMLSHLFFAALRSPAWKGLTSWLLLVMFIVVLLLSHVVSWFRCGTWLYRFLIFAVLLLQRFMSGLAEAPKSYVILDLTICMGCFFIFCDCSSCTALICWQCMIYYFRQSLMNLSSLRKQPQECL